MSTVLFPTNSLNKASGLLLLLVRVRTGHVHFLDNEIREPMRPTTVFFSCSTPEKCSGKLPTESVERRHIQPVFKLEKETTFEPKQTHSNPYGVVAMLYRQQHIPRCIPTLKSRACYNYATRLLQYVGALWCAYFDGSRTHERWP